MHFGMYLKRKGVISAEQLVDALETQMKRLPPIGQLALEEGILSARDIFHVLQTQSSAPGERFGDLAVEMGLMTRDEVIRLLMIQADRKPRIADILVQQRILTRQHLENELSAYRQSLLDPKRETKTTRFVPIPRNNAARADATAIAAV